MQESLGDYRILERIGAGGTAEVFRARDTRRGRTAAIKVLTSEVAMDPVQGPIFVTEANLAVALGHPNTAALYEIEERDGRPHLVFEFVQGQTLSALVAGRPINPRRAVDFAMQIADGLADAHATGLAHRVLRPDKIIVTLKGTAKIIDFGLGQYAMAVARRQAGAGPEPAAMAYWAPEQRAGAPGDHRSDIHALGLILVEMLTGKPPVKGRVPETGLPPELLPLVRRLLASAPERRPDAAATVAAELRSIAAGFDAKRDATPVGPAGPARTAAAPGLPAWAIGALVLAAVVVAGVIWFVSAR